MLVWYLSYPYDFRARHLKAHEDPPLRRRQSVYFDRPDPRHLPCLVHPNVDSEEDPRG